MDGLHGHGLNFYVTLLLLNNFFHNSVHGNFRDQKICRSLILPDLSQGLHTWSESSYPFLRFPHWGALGIFITHIDLLVGQSSHTALLLDLFILVIFCSLIQSLKQTFLALFQSFLVCLISVTSSLTTSSLHVCGTFLAISGNFKSFLFSLSLNTQSVVILFNLWLMFPDFQYSCCNK